MGNILCKERHQPRRKYVKSPIDQVLRGPGTQTQGQFATNVYPNSINYANPMGKNGTNQMYYNSVPNLNKNGGLTSSIILPDPKIFDDGIHRPIPPIRRKKLQKAGTLPAKLTNPMEIHPNNKEGFKDIFGEIRSTSCAALDTVDGKTKVSQATQTRAISCFEINTENQTTPKKLQVGNRKSDKFFGESLSDSLSDEPIDKDTTLETKEIQRKPRIVGAQEKVKEPEPLDDSINSQTMNNSLDKKAAFLMRMLEEDDEDRYKGKEPIEEPLFVATKKVKRHICDDDDHIRSCLHKHEKEEEEKTAKAIAEDQMKDQQMQRSQFMSQLSADDNSENVEIIEKPVEVSVKSQEQRESSPKVQRFGSLDLISQIIPEKIPEEEEKSHQIEVAAEISHSPSPDRESYKSHDPLHLRTSMELLHLNMAAEREASQSPPMVLPFEQQGPKKPDRDFSKYKKIETDADEIEVERPVRTKKLSRENLPSPPETPVRKSPGSSGPSTPEGPVARKATPTPAQIQTSPPIGGIFAQLIDPDFPRRRAGFTKQMSEPPMAEKKVEFESQLSDPAKRTESPTIEKPKIQPPTPPTIKVDNTGFVTSTPRPVNMRMRKISAPQGPKEISEALSNPRLFQKPGGNSVWSRQTNDLMDSIIKKAYGFHEFNPEDHGHGVADISITPTSKLTTRKVSVPRKSPTPDGSSNRSISPRPMSTSPINEEPSKRELVPPPRAKKEIKKEPKNPLIKKHQELDLDKLIKKIEKKEEPVEDEKVEVVEAKKEERTKQKLGDIKEENYKEKMEERKDNLSVPLKPLAIPKESSNEPLKSPGLTKSADMKVSPSKFMNPLNDLIDEIYSQDSEVMVEFQQYLEKTLVLNPVIDTNAFLNVKEMPRSSSNTPEPAPPKAKINKIKNPESDAESDADVQTYSDSFESSDDEDERKARKMKILNKNLMIDDNVNGIRRGSIEEFTEIFTSPGGVNEDQIHGKLDDGIGTPTTFGEALFQEQQKGPDSDDLFSQFSKRISQSLSPYHADFVSKAKENIDNLEEKPSNSIQVKTEEHSDGSTSNVTTIVKIELHDQKDGEALEENSKIEISSDEKTPTNEEFKPFEKADGKISPLIDLGSNKTSETTVKEHRKSNVVISWPLERDSSCEMAGEKIEVSNTLDTSFNNCNKSKQSEPDHSSSADHSLLLKYFEPKNENSNQSN